MKPKFVVLRIFLLYTVLFSSCNKNANEFLPVPKSDCLVLSDIDESRKNSVSYTYDSQKRLVKKSVTKEGKYTDLYQYSYDADLLVKILKTEYFSGIIVNKIEEMYEYEGKLLKRRKIYTANGNATPYIEVWSEKHEYKGDLRSKTSFFTITNGAEEFIHSEEYSYNTFNKIASTKILRKENYGNAYFWYNELITYEYRSNQTLERKIITNAKEKLMTQELLYNVYEDEVTKRDYQPYDGKVALSDEQANEITYDGKGNKIQILTTYISYRTNDGAYSQTPISSNPYSLRTFSYSCPN